MADMKVERLPEVISSHCWSFIAAVFTCEKGSSPVHEDGIACCKDAHKDKCNNLPSRERVSGDPFGKFCVQSCQSNMKLCQTDIGTGCAI